MNPRYIDHERRAAIYRNWLSFTNPAALHKADGQIRESERWCEQLPSAPIRILAKPVASELGGKRRKSA